MKLLIALTFMLTGMVTGTKAGRTDRRRNTTGCWACLAG